MLKALLWKEWREQRAIAFTGALVALMIPASAVISASGSGPDLLEVVDILAFLSAVVVWPLFAALAGAAANAERASSASSTFLLSRPIGRGRLWLIKVAIALVSVGLVVAVSFYASFRIYLWGGGQFFRFPFGSDPLPLSDDVVRALALGGLLVTFCSALLLSTFVRRSMAAAFAGVAVGIGSQAIGLVAVGHIGERGVAPGASIFLAGYSSLLAAAVLVASLYAFRVSGLVGSGGGGGTIVRATAGIMAALPLIIACAGFASTRITPDNAGVAFEHTVPGTDSIVVRLYRRGLADSSLWAATPDAPMRRLTTRLTRAIAVSPNGEWLAYVSRRSILGTRSSRCDVRAVRIDGTGDRSLLTIDSPTWCVRAGAFSPDSERLAVEIRSPSRIPRRIPQRLFVAGLVGDAAREFDLSAIVAAPRYFVDYKLEWLSRGELLISSHFDYWLINTNDGAIRNTYERPRGGAGLYTQDLAHAGSLLLVQEEHGFPGTRDVTFEFKLVDLAAGSTREIEPLCVPTLGRVQDAGGDWFWTSWGPFAALTADGSRVLYTCPRPLLAENDLEIIDYTGPWESTLIRRDLATGAEAVVVKMEGQVGVGPMPDGRRFVVSFWDTSGLRPRFEILEEDGTLRPVDYGPEWTHRQWFDNRRLLLRSYRRLEHGFSQSLAYLDIDEPSEPRRFNLTSEWRR